jgi:hypothetical protein
VSERRGSYTDTIDEQWALIEPIVSVWEAAHPSVSGHSGRCEMRRIVDAIFYQTGRAASGACCRTVSRRPRR